MVNSAPAVIVNANNIMALSVMRSLGRKGLQVIAVFGNTLRNEPYAYIIRTCRFISKSYAFDATDYETNFLQRLTDIGKSGACKAVLFPVSDTDMLLVSKHRDSLRKYYHLLLPPADILNMLLKKEMFYEYALREKLPIPRTFMPRDSTEILEVSRQVRYPCIIKPSWRTAEWIAHYGNKKALRCDSPAELIEQYRETVGYFSILTVQEYVMGPETNIVCSFTYLDSQSKPLGVFICRKIRQYPHYFGNTSMAEAAMLPEVEELSLRICRQLELVGYVSIEFKRDERDNEYKILEITPARINRQTGLSAECGVNIPYIWYSYLLGLRVKVESGGKPYRWVSEVNELRSAFFYLKNREWTLLEWLKSYRNVRRWEVFAYDDLKPALMLLPSVLMYWIGKVWHLRHRS